MENNLFTDKEFTSLARKIVQARKLQKPVAKEMYQDIIARIRKLDAAPAGMLIETMVDAVQHLEKDIPQQLNPSVSFAAVIEGSDSTESYTPKMREATLPVLYKGSAWSMQELTTRTVHPLHYLYLSECGTEVLRAFDSYTAVENFTERHSLIQQLAFQLDTADKANNDLQQQSHTYSYYDCSLLNAPKPNGDAVFYEHIDFNGEELALAPGRNYPNLPDNWRNWFLFFKTDDWNDAISSIKSGHGIIVCKEHSFNRGASLTIYGSNPVPVYKSGHPQYYCPYVEYWKYLHPRINIPRLTSIGWNDRISSLYHYVVR